MPQPISNLTIPSEMYENISYSVYVNSFKPEPGTLNYSLLRHNVNVSCVISVSSSMLNDYEFAVITLAYKQVKTKSKRYKLLLTDPVAKSNVLYRGNLQNLINQYKATLTTTDDFFEGRALLLNDLTSTIDQKVGDTGIQCLFRFQKFDGTSEYVLLPGGPLRKLSSVIGLSVFSAVSIEEVLNNIIIEMSSLVSQYILPHSGLCVSSSLNDDIQRYLRFCFYGE